MAKEDGGAHTGDADEIVFHRVVAISIGGHFHRVEAISIGGVDEKIGTGGSASTGEETAWKKLVLGVEPINCFNLLLNWYLETYNPR